MLPHTTASNVTAGEPARVFESLEAFLILSPLYSSTRNPAHPPRGRARLYYSTRTRRALRHPSISRQTYHRDKVGPPNPQANQESCVSFPFRTEITRPELPDPPPSSPRHLALKSPSATRPERGQLSQVLDGTVEHRRATPKRSHAPELHRSHPGSRTCPRPPPEGKGCSPRSRARCRTSNWQRCPTSQRAGAFHVASLAGRLGQQRPDPA